jgi:DNA-binding winged helix-turn-helix (wHTH) protein
MDSEFRIGPWLVRPSLNIISQDGTTVHLEPKVMEVLVCLARRAGESVPRKELIQTVWPGTFVTDDVVKRCVSELRRAFRDDAHEPRIIETIRKRGYRLLASVEKVQSPNLNYGAAAVAVDGALPGTQKESRVHHAGRAQKFLLQASAGFLLMIACATVAYVRGKRSIVLAPPSTVTVGCGGISGIYDYTTIQAALDAILGLPGSFTIVVAGNCSESLSIFDRRSITIVGLSGASVFGRLQHFGTRRSPNDNDAFDIIRSQGITIENLDISSTGPDASGLFISQGSEAKIVGCNIHNNQGTAGVFVTRNSVLALQGSTIENNVPGDGLDVIDNSTAYVTGTTIQNNGSAGVGNAFGQGVFIRDSFVRFADSLIQNNADFGIGAVKSSLSFNGSNNTIQGHNINGISLKLGSDLQIGPALIQGNGKGCPADTALLVSVSQACGGISVADSTATMRAGTINGNYGAGISLREGAHLTLTGATVANNFGDGVHIQWTSIGNFGSANSITGNVGASVFCDSRSLVLGNLEGLINVKCLQNSQ